jgi:putative membrane protein
MSGNKRKPAAFRLDDPDVIVEDGGASRGAKSKAGTAPKKTIEIEIEPDLREAVDDLAASPATADARPKRNGWGLGGLLVTALGGLFSLALGLWITSLIEALFARAEWLGWLGIALAGLCGFSG